MAIPLIVRTLRIHRLRYATHAQTKLDLVGWIEGLYNSAMFASSIDYKSPTEFERGLAPA